MLIRVTDKHIKKGKKRTNDNCPIALAAIDAGCSNVSVGLEGITISHRPFTRKALPKTAQDFIDAFDKGKKVKPFEFTI